MTPKELYQIYRQVIEITETLKEGERYLYEDAVKIGERFSEELFRLVGKLAAYEIDNEYFKNNKD